MERCDRIVGRTNPFAEVRPVKIVERLRIFGVELVRCNEDLTRLFENQAGFYGSQMTAMDNATRNAGDMINRLSIQYNRTRQAVITTELIEIISGAEAL
jgi:ATP synthase F1 gamma subunit